jgi:DNA-binding protein HU-beta
MAKMSKSQILAAMAESTGLSKKDVKNFMDKVVELAYQEVKKNGEFVLPGFGKMVKINRPARTGRNPATGATIQIPAKTVLKFRVAKAAKDALL